MTDPDLSLNDGNTMPQLGFGLWQVPQSEAARVVSDGIVAGYRLVDGAAIYGNEAEMGVGMRASGRARADLFLTSKVWNAHHGFDACLAALDATLVRIGVDYLDLALIHWPCPSQNRYVETWKALIAAREAGKARSIGVSNFLPAHLERIIGETGVTPAVNQIEVHPELQQATARADHAAKGIVTQDWTPLGQSRSFNAPAIRAAAERAGKTRAQIVLRWHVQIGSSVIPRSTSAERLVENREIFDFALSDAEMTAIAALDKVHRIGPDPSDFEEA